MRKNFIYLLLLVSATLFASGVNWAKDYQSAMIASQKQNKPVMFIHSRHSCKWCVFLDETTFADKKIIKLLNKDFIAVTSYTDENDYTPKELYTPGTPTIWFLYPDGQIMFEPIMGAMKPKDFLPVLKIVKTEFDKAKNTKVK